MRIIHNELNDLRITFDITVNIKTKIRPDTTSDITFFRHPVCTYVLPIPKPTPLLSVSLFTIKRNKTIRIQLTYIR